MSEPTRSGAERPDQARQQEANKSESGREQVERHADRIREELLLTLEELDRRRGRALDVRYQLGVHRDGLIKVGAVVAGAVMVTAGLLYWRARHRQQILARRRWEGLKRAWDHPERLATGSKERPFTVEFGEKLVTIFGGALATALARRSVQTLMDMRGGAVGPGQPQPQPAPKRAGPTPAAARPGEAQAGSPVH